MWADADYRHPLGELSSSSARLDIRRYSIVSIIQSRGLHGSLMLSSSIILQEAFLFTRRDASLSQAIRQRGVLDPMFSDSNKDTALHLFWIVEEVAALLQRYEKTQQVTIDDQVQLRNVIRSIGQAIDSKHPGHTTGDKVEGFLTAKALSIKIFLETILHHSTNNTDHSDDTANQLMRVLQEPQEQVSPLTLCVTLGSVFWQTTMGAIAASNAQTRSFYTSRLQRIVVPLAVKSWNDALTVLQRFLWIPSIFSGPCRLIFSEIMDLQSYTNR